MNTHEEYMQRCLDLAKLGRMYVAPNPMVGCVIVLNDAIIGQGYHKKYGEAHAEVNAINSVNDSYNLTKATLYVNLEPCSHFGKTPPCADLIIERKIPYVVIGSIDSNSSVSGQGIRKLINAGIDVKIGIVEQECKNLNKRFFTFHEKKRPYIILKWAETKDGYIDGIREFGENKKPLQISNLEAKKLVHTWRAEEQAIIVGTRTALLDNPKLTVREITGINPIRITIDKDLKIPDNYFLFDKSSPTLIFTEKEKKSTTHLEYIVIDFKKDVIEQLLNELYNRNIQSILVEGGKNLLQQFIDANLWDESRVFVSEQLIKKGISAPKLKLTPKNKTIVNGISLLEYINK